jgi:hypothetical protein
MDYRRPGRQGLCVFSEIWWGKALEISVGRLKGRWKDKMDLSETL